MGFPPVGEEAIREQEALWGIPESAEFCAWGQREEEGAPGQQEARLQVQLVPCAPSPLSQNPGFSAFSTTDM